MKLFWKKAGIMVLFLAITAGLTGCMGEAPEAALGLFSWKDNEIRQSSGLLRVAKKLGFTEIYQSFTKEISVREIQDFISDMSKAGLDVYYLTGDPSWGMDQQGTRLLEEVRTAAGYGQGGGEGFRGVVMDVEPYLTDEWEEDMKETMESYVAAMKLAYREAKGLGLRFIICIPYYYDEKGLEELTEELIRDGCDAIAVMNYQKADEAGQIAWEVETAVRYGKAVIQIYELQEPGKYDLTDRNTYYNDGLEAVLESREGLLKAFPKAKLSFAYHDYRALEEMEDYE